MLKHQSNKIGNKNGYIVKYCRNSKILAVQHPCERPPSSEGSEFGFGIIQLCILREYPVSQMDGSSTVDRGLFMEQRARGDLSG